MRHDTAANANSQLIGSSLARVADGPSPYRTRDVVLTVTDLDGRVLRRFRVGVWASSDGRAADGVEDCLSDSFGKALRELTPDGPTDSYLPVVDQLSRSLAHETEGPDRVDEEN